MISRITHRVQLEWKLINIKFSNLVFEPENSLVIFSDPRGGSTWLSEILNQIPNSIIYWEPLFKRYINEVNDIGFGWRQHIPIDEDWPEARNLFENILSLKIINEWTCMKFTAKEFMNCKVPIIKFCRANHLAPWLCKQFQFNYKPILLLRHPFAVAASQLKQGGWEFSYSEFQVPEMPYNEVYLDNLDFLKSLKSKEEWLVAQWCITNRELVVESDKWHLLFYEEFIATPETYLNKIFKDWNLPIPDSISLQISKASSTSVDLMSNPQDQLAKWENYFGDDKIIKLQRILDHFGVGVYSMGSLYPNRDNY